MSGVDRSRVHARGLRLEQLKQEIDTILAERVNPILAAHFGAAELSCFSDGIAWVKLTGACGTCPSAQYTIEDVVREELMNACPEIKDVRLDNGVSDDLIDFARGLLNRKR